MEIRDGEEVPKGEHGKIKIVVTGNNLDLLKNLESIPVCQTRVSSNAIFCGGCLLMDTQEMQ